MKISNVVKVGVAVLTASVMLTGCATKLSVEKQAGKLNLESEKLHQASSLNHVIAIVSPKMSAIKKEESTLQGNSFNALMMQKMMMQNNSYNFGNAFQSNYAQRLDKAMEGSTSEIISSKGFKLRGPYAEFDDMTYGEKKSAYLAFVPKIEFTIDNKVLNSKNYRLYSHTDGVIQVGGNFSIEMVEPMTGQVFLKKRINLSDFNIEESYTYEKQFREGGGLNVSTAIDKASAPDKLVDNTDVALTNAINKFYAQAIEKINKYLDREEILSFEEEILKLKGLKRF